MRDEQGVSPVIATILMVAITVVLAATVYIMVAGMTTQSSQRPLSGNLVYKSDISDPDKGKASFELVAHFPSEPKITSVHITLIDGNGNIISSTEYTYSWNHIASKDTEHVTGGDLLEITMNTPTDMSGYNVVISIDGYTGTIKGIVP